MSAEPLGTNEDGLFVCCADLNNRMTMQVEDSETGNYRDDLIVSVCQVCQRRHFELSVDTGFYNFRGESI